MTSTEPLAGFEERRLAELTEHVRTRAGEGRGRRAPAVKRHRLVLAAATVAGVCAATAVTSQRGGEPAYAVTRESHGVVVITVRDFRDAPALSRRLHDLGVPAIVDYVPHGASCKEPRGTAVQNIPPGLYSPPTNIPGEDSDSGWQMRIDTRLFRPGQTFVWEISTSPDGGSHTSTILMEGRVAPCALTPVPTP
jgi:hypothetical protein